MHEGLVYSLVIVYASCVLLDAVGLIRFLPYAFMLGPAVLRREMPGLPRPTEPLGTELATDAGKYKVITPDQVLLRERFRFMHRSHDVRGRVWWDDHGAHVEGRLSPALFLGAVMLAIEFIYLAPLTGSTSELLRWAVGTGLMFVFMAVLAAFAVLTGRSRLADLIDEYETASRRGPHA